MRFVREAAMPTAHKAVLWSLALRADKTGSCYPSLERIGRDAGMSSRHACRVIGELSRGPLVTARRRRSQATLYRLHVPDTMSGTDTTSVSETDTTSDELPKELPKDLSRAARPRLVEATQLTETWSLPEQLADWAQGQGLSADEVASEAERFRDYYLGNGAVRADWRATWRSWVRRVPEFRRTQPPRSKPKACDDPDKLYEQQLAYERMPRRVGPTAEQMAGFDAEAARRRIDAELGLGVAV
jgi:hypothetical protein